MSSEAPSREPLFLVLAPVGREAQLICDIIEDSGHRCLKFDSLEELIDRVGRGEGPIVLTAEALHAAAVDPLLDLLADQPSWSDVPLILFTSRHRNAEVHRVLMKHNPTVLQRPIAVQSFRGVIQTTGEARQRQLEVCDLLDELEETNEQLQLRTRMLRELSLELSIVEHRERRRVANLLHDHLQQLLAAAKLRLNRLRRRLDDDKLRKQTDAIEGLVAEAISSSRLASYQLSPPILHQSGLGAAAEWLAKTMRSEHNLEVELTIDQGDKKLSEPLRVFMFQALRELLFNVTKHADVDRANVEIQIDDEQITIEVSDDGRGFDPTSLRQYSKRNGFGLFALAERIEMLEGSLDIETGPGHGCHITIRAPQDDRPSSPQMTTTTAESPEAVPLESSPVVTASPGALRVVLADDHGLMRRGLATLLDDEPDIAVVGEASSGREAVDLARTLRPDVVIMDVSMDDLDGIEATRLVRSELPEVKVVALSMFENRAVADEMLEAGAAIYLTKSGPLEQLLAAIRGCRE